MAALPVLAAAAKLRLQVAAIDFGTTYSGYAFSFRTDFDEDPLKIHTNQWESNGGNGPFISLKAPTCALFSPEGELYKFGYDAEDHYSNLCVENQHQRWYFFRHFKMMLYDIKDLRRDARLTDDKGLQMPARKVFAACIRYLKEHLLSLGEEKHVGLLEDEIHWVLTVPAIWNDVAKQFMREAAVEAGIQSENLSLALEPEAASIFCRHMPVEKVEGADGIVGIASFAPGKRYLVLDAGGGTVDITVHETQEDGTVKEVYKANGGPWGGTKIDEAFRKFLDDIVGKDVMDKFAKDNKDDYIELFRDFEVKKKALSPDMDQGSKITFRMPLAIHETFREVRGQELRENLFANPGLKDRVTLTGDKLRVYPDQVFSIFEETCNQIVTHLTDIFNKPDVAGTDTILMVGGFSESAMLRHAVRSGFPDHRVVIPEDAGLAVLKGAVIFGHCPTAIISRRAPCTYGIAMIAPFLNGFHDESRKFTLDGEDLCNGVFDKHVGNNDEVKAGTKSEERTYYPLDEHTLKTELYIFTSEERHPIYTDNCQFLGTVEIDLSDIPDYTDRAILVSLVYGNTMLGVEAKIANTGEVIKARFNFYKE